MNGIKRYAFAYIDYLLFMMIALFMLFAISFMQMAKKAEGNIISKAEFIIEMEWEDGSRTDMDLWVSNPTGLIAYYKDRDLGLMTQDRDDLGFSNNRVEVGGQTYVDTVRKEVTTIRSSIPGQYTVNAVMYQKRSPEPSTVTITVRKLNPYREVYKATKLFTQTKQEQTFVQFELDANGNVISTDPDTQVSLYQRLQLK